MSHAHARVGFGNTYAPIAPQNLLFTHATNSGSFEMNIEASGVGDGGVEFIYECSANKTVCITRMNWSILDAGITYGSFGGIANGLASGILIDVLDNDDTLLLDFLDGSAIKTNVDFGKLSGVDLAPGSDFPNPDGLIVRWSLFRTGGQLILSEGQKLRITIQDDLSSLEQFNALIQGSIFDE